MVKNCTRSFNLAPTSQDGSWKIFASRWRSISLGLALASVPVGGEVVINEIFYHPPNDLEDLQFIEVHNAATNPVDLSGWSLAGGIESNFAVGSSLAGQGYFVLAANPERFQEYYGFSPAGTFRGTLSRKGTRISLLNAQGQRIDDVSYQDSPPWPAGADGYSASLERICPSADGNLSQNWAASPLPRGEIKPAGTPGQKNANFAASLPPLISDVRFSPASPRPGEEVTVEAQVDDARGAREVTLRYRLAAPGGQPAELTLPMTKLDRQRWTGKIPGQQAGQLVRFRIQAVNQQGAERYHPGANEPQPAFSYFVADKPEGARIPLAFILNTDQNDQRSIEQHLQATSGTSDGQQLRLYAQMQMEAALQLSPLWFELAVVQQSSFEQMSKLRPVFVANAAERDRLIAEPVKASDYKEAREKIGQIADAFHQGVASAVKPLLNDAQYAKATELLPQKKASRGPQPITPDALLRRFLKLEDTFFKLTIQFELTQPVFQQIAEIHRAGVSRRAEVTPVVQALTQGQGELADVHDKLDAIRTSVGKQVESLLTREQRIQWKRWLRESESAMAGKVRTPPPKRPQGSSAFVYIPPETGAPEVYDFITVTERNSGLNVHFLDAQHFHEMSTINLFYEVNDRFVLAEPLAYELYRRVGVPAPTANHLRLTVDGRPLGLYLAVEQPNRAFLRRHRRDARGNLYKILWYGRSVEGQHEKKTHRKQGHEDLIELLSRLEQSRHDPDAQWSLIEKHFHVPQVIDYFAVNMCLSHWDGFFNNYFAYHDARGTGRWEMYPWDQDKTWGFHDGLKPGQVFYDMPVTFGMEGDRPPGYPKDRPAPRGFAGDTAWWRPGGPFSKPLLANPHFRKQFLGRTKEILQTVYSEEAFFPAIDTLGTLLAEEVRWRARILNQDPDQAGAMLQDNLKSLKEHLTRRRQFLLEQEEIRSASRDG